MANWSPKHGGSYNKTSQIRNGRQNATDLPKLLGWVDIDRMPQLRREAINNLGPRQIGRHFPDDIFKCIFLNVNTWISLKISLKLVHKDGISNIPAFIQIMAWHRTDDTPLNEPMMVGLPTHICIIKPQWVNSTKVTRTEKPIFSCCVNSNVFDKRNATGFLTRCGLPMIYVW